MAEAKKTLAYPADVINDLLEKVESGSVVVENTLSTLDETSNKPVNSQGIAEAITQATDSIEDKLAQLESEVWKNSIGIAFQNVKTNGAVLNVVETRGLLQKGNLLKFALVSNSYSTHRVSVYLIRVDGSYVSAGILDKLEVEKEYLITEDFDYVRFYNDSGSGGFEARIAILTKNNLIEPISADVADTKEKVSAMELQSENGKVCASTGSSALNVLETIGLLKRDKTIRFSLVSDAYENHSIGVYLMRANGSYVSLGTITEIGAEKTYRITEDFEYIRFYNNKGPEPFSVKLSIVRSVADSISVMSAKIFRRVGCIGDSYTSGHIHLQGANAVVANYDYAWPHYMSGLTNNKWTNFGQSGSTAKQWVVGASRLGEVKESGNKCQAYVIGLMINDQGSWSSYATPVGNKSDIGTDADTYYAWYYKLVQEVISVNASAKIFCNTCPNYANNFAYNVAVRDIVAHCKSNGQNVYLCDLASDKYNNETYYKNPIFLSDAVNGHFTAIGYEYMAECYIRVLSDVINSNLAEFQDVFQIPCDL